MSPGPHVPGSAREHVRCWGRAARCRWVTSRDGATCRVTPSGRYSDRLPATAGMAVRPRRIVSSQSRCEPDRGAIRVAPMGVAVFELATGRLSNSDSEPLVAIYRERVSRP